MKQTTIGLFGTCGNSTWRKKFIETYNKEGIPFFNPQVENWTPDCAKEEARHLVEDEIILFPVLAETYGCGSLAEIGFCVAQGVLNPGRQFIILVDSKPDPYLDEDGPGKSKVTYKESSRTRALVRAHLEKLQLDNVHVVETLDEMLSASMSEFWNFERGNRIK